MSVWHVLLGMAIGLGLLFACGIACYMMVSLDEVHPEPKRLTDVDF